MKFYFRRAVFAIVTAPFLFLAYGVLFFTLALLSNEPQANPIPIFFNNLPVVGIAYFLVMLFLPQITKFVDQL